MSACPIADEAIETHAKHDKSRDGRRVVAYVLIVAAALGGFAILKQTNHRLERDYTALCKSVRRGADVQVSVLRNGLEAAEQAHDTVKVARLNGDIKIASQPVLCEKEAP